MNDSLRNLFTCADDFQHHFRALGGANQYPGFMNWHIPAFVVLLFLDKSILEFLPDGILRSTGKVQDEIRSRFKVNPPTPQDVSEFITFTNKQVMKFKDPKENLNWLNFCEEIKHN